VGGSVRANNFKKCIKLNCNFQRDRRALDKIPPVGGGGGEKNFLGNLKIFFFFNFFSWIFKKLIKLNYIFKGEGGALKKTPPGGGGGGRYRHFLELYKLFHFSISFPGYFKSRYLKFSHYYFCQRKILMIMQTFVEQCQTLRAIFYACVTKR